MSHTEKPEWCHPNIAIISSRIECVLQSSQIKRFNRTSTIWNHTARKKERANSWRVPNCKRPCVLVRWFWLFGYPSLNREYPKDWLQATYRKEWLHDVVPYSINYRWRKLAHFYVGKQLRLNFLLKIMINLCIKAVTWISNRFECFACFAIRI